MINLSKKPFANLNKKPFHNLNPEAYTKLEKRAIAKIDEMFRVRPKVDLTKYPLESEELEDFFSKVAKEVEETVSRELEITEYKPPQHQWGDDTFKINVKQIFLFDTPFEEPPNVLISVIDIKETVCLVPDVVSIYGFTIKKDDSIDHDIDFQYIAIPKEKKEENFETTFISGGKGNPQLCTYSHNSKVSEYGGIVKVIDKSFM